MGGGGCGAGVLRREWREAELLDALLPPADAKLPPFTGYTSHLSINGISGHHYHAIAQRLPEENNNFAPAPPTYPADHAVVSSSTPADADPDDAEPHDLRDVKPFALDADPPAKLFDDKPDMYDISSIDDFAAIISSALADTTVPSQHDDERGDSRDSWMDIDAWIAGSVPDKPAPELAEFLPASPPQPYADCKPDFLHKGLNAGSTLQSLLTHGYMPLLQSRLTHGPPSNHAPEAPSSTSAGQDATSTSGYASCLLKDGLCSPERLLYPAHTTHSAPSKPKRSRAKPRATPHGLGFAPQELGPLLGKEKPVHRCGICNRGFLNKSNIKVHLRTHTGEKPFRCDVCSKAFRQKAHLIKHQQIHKRIGRD